MEFLQNLEWWHWIAFGLVLAVSEIVVPLFVVIWFGLGAIVVGFIKYIFDTTLLTNLAVWITLSVVMLTIWFKFFRDKKIDKSGQANYRLDTRGIVTKAIKHGYKGKVHFDTPVLGSSDWHATSSEDIEVGKKVKIIEVSGQLIKVKEVKS